MPSIKTSPNRILADVVAADEIPPVCRSRARATMTGSQPFFFKRMRIALGHASNSESVNEHSGAYSWLFSFGCKPPSSLRDTFLPRRRCSWPIASSPPIAKR